MVLTGQLIFATDKRLTANFRYRPPDPSPHRPYLEWELLYNTVKGPFSTNRPTNRADIWRSWRVTRQVSYTRFVNYGAFSGVGVPDLDPP